MVRKLAWMFAGVGLLCASALGQPPEAAPKPTIRLLPNYVASDIPKGGPPQVELPPVPQPLPKIVAVEPRALPPYEHMAIAADHLEAAGLKDEAAKLRERAEQERRNSDGEMLARKLSELARLQSEVDELRRRTGQTEQIQLQLTICEVDCDRLQSAGLTLPIGSGDGDAQEPRRSAGATGEVIENDAALVAKLQEAKEAGAVKVLAEPVMITTSGQPAAFFSGGEIPIPVPGRDSSPVDWRRFGVHIEAVPRVLGNGMLRISVHPEITDRDFSNSITIAGQIIPGLTTRRVNTEVAFYPGQTFVLSGLRSTRTVIQASGEQENRSSELLILMRAEMVQPAGAGQIGNQTHDRELR